MENDAATSLTRRDLLRMIGVTAGSTAMYQAMDGLGFAAESPYRGRSICKVRRQTLPC